MTTFTDHPAGVTITVSSFWVEINDEHIVRPMGASIDDWEGFWGRLTDDYPTQLHEVVEELETFRVDHYAACTAYREEIKTLKDAVKKLKARNNANVRIIQKLESKPTTKSPSEAR